MFALLSMVTCYFLALFIYLFILQFKTKGRFKANFFIYLFLQKLGKIMW